jgi:hypothetical protein
MEKSEAQKMVTLYGKARRLQLMNLPHENFCKALGECRCRIQEVVTSKTIRDGDQAGTKLKIHKNKRVNATVSVRFLHKTEIEKAALECPEVKAAIESNPPMLMVIW